MKVTLKQIINSKDSLNQLGSINFHHLVPSSNFPNFQPLKISYDVKKRLKVLRAELELIEEQSRELGREMSGGKIKKVVFNNQIIETWDCGENQQEYEKAVKEFLKQETELNITPIPAEDLANAPLTPSNLEFLDYLISDPV